MDEVDDKAGKGLFAVGDGTLMEDRLFRMMFVVVAASLAASLLLFSWKISVGLLIGGSLSLLNHYWLRTSMAAAFSANQGRPRIRATRFFLRYFVVVTVVAAAYSFDIASLTAMLVGMCSFVVAALVEASAQVFLTFIHREGT
jgi:hypothetical protein